MHSIQEAQKKRVGKFEGFRGSGKWVLQAGVCLLASNTAYSLTTGLYYKYDRNIYSIIHLVS